MVVDDLKQIMFGILKCHVNAFVFSNDFCKFDNVSMVEFATELEKISLLGNQEEGKMTNEIAIYHDAEGTLVIASNFALSWRKGAVGMVLNLPPSLDMPTEIRRYNGRLRPPYQL